MHNCLIVLSHFGGPTRGRTWDSPVMIRRLCQLSYGFYSLIFQHFRRYSQYFQSNSARNFFVNKGYILTLDIIARPALMVFGATASIAIWLAASAMCNTLLSNFLNGFTANSGKSVIVELILTIIVMIVFYFLYAKVFSFCINEGPSAIMDWLGQASAKSLSGDESSGQQITGAAGAVVGRGLRGF